VRHDNFVRDSNLCGFSLPGILRFRERRSGESCAKQSRTTIESHVSIGVQPKPGRNQLHSGRERNYAVGVKFKNLGHGIAVGVLDWIPFPSPYIQKSIGDLIPSPSCKMLRSVSVSSKVLQKCSHPAGAGGPTGG